MFYKQSKTCSVETIYFFLWKIIYYIEYRLYNVEKYFISFMLFNNTLIINYHITSIFNKSKYKLSNLM